MIVISHRGKWTNLQDRNRPIAFRRSFDNGFGTETDVRDRAGRLVIAHDMATEHDLDFDDMLDIMAGRDLPLALNIKADGLGRALADRISVRGLTRWFTFDMSVPDMIMQLALGLPAYTRVSDHEKQPVCYDRAVGVWLDSFDTDWFGSHHIRGFLSDGKPVCVVSPELHGRDPAAVWRLLRTPDIAHHPALMLCTDQSEQASVFFLGAL